MELSMLTENLGLEEELRRKSSATPVDLAVFILLKKI